VDFVIEWTDTELPPLQIQAECWTLYFDGSVMKTGAGAGLLFISPLGEHMIYTMRLHFPRLTIWRSTRPSSAASKLPSKLASNASTSGEIRNL
jgi:hypothetical protein